MERKQFTFYKSFFEAIKKIKKPADRAAAYDAICEYALYGVEPDIEKISDAASIVFDLVKPNLDSSRKKAENGKRGGSSKQGEYESKSEANSKQNESTDEANSKQEREGDRDRDRDRDRERMLYPQTPKSSPVPPEAPQKVAFADFWERYPVKVHETEAMIAFSLAKQDQPAIMAGLNRWLRSGIWRTVRAPAPDAFILDRIWGREPGNGGGKL